MNKYSEFEDKEEKSIDYLAIYYKYLSYWKWFWVSMVLCVGLAIIYVKFALPTYQIDTSIILKDDQKGGGTAEVNAFKDMGLFIQKNNVDNGLEMLSKSILAEQAVRELGLNTTYVKMGTYSLLKNMGFNLLKYDIANFKEQVIYGAECPILVSLPEPVLNKMPEGVEFRVLIHPYGEYEFSGEFNDNKYVVKASISDKQVMLPFGKLSIVRGAFRPTEDMLIHITMQVPLGKAAELLQNLKLELTSKTTSVVNISLKASNVEMGRDFLARLIDVFNRVDLIDKSKMALKTANFIDDRLITISKDLGDVESQVENYKQVQGITDIKSQTDFFIQQTGDFTQKRMDIEPQLAIVTDIDNYINRKENRLQPLPANSGINSPGLSELIANYNKLLLDRNRLSRIASSSNQAMIDLTNQIESLFSTVQSSVRNERNNLRIAQRDLMSKNNQNTAQIRAIPRQEREYTEIKRQQGIKEALFLFLLQKKEEKYLNGAIVEPAAKLIDNVIGISTPVAPKKMFILFFSMVVGLLLPIAGIKIRDLLRYQIADREELEKLTKVPILGEICRSDLPGHVLIKENNTDGFTELFRLLRTNLLFVMDGSNKKVVNMVSSVGGEGKTFVSINLAISLALLDKKVLIIGLDVRKPKLSEYLGIDNETGITMFLSGHLTKDKLIRPLTNVHPNLSIITSGPIPPNPNELLAKHSLDNLIAELRQDFDYIIIDTAPIGVVSDSFSLNRLADVNLYIVRADYTPKKYVMDAGVLYNQNKLKDLYFVLNDTQDNQNKFRSGYGRKYGYGYKND